MQEPTSNRDPRGLATATRAVVLTLGSLCLLRVGRDFFLPLITAGFLVYLVEVLSRLIQRLRIRGCRLPNALCTAFAFGLIFGLGYAFSLVVIDNALQISAAAPRYQIRLQQVISQGLAALGLERQPELKDLVRAVDLRAAFGIATRTVSRTLSNATLVLLYGLFIVLELRFLASKLATVFPDKAKRDGVVALLSRIDRDIHAYVAIKTAVSFLTALLSFGVMRWVGLQWSTFWALLVFVLNFIPTLGSAIATVLPAAFALLQFEALTPSLILLVGITAVQQVMGSLIEPNLIGQRLNLSPLTVIIALVFWGSLWGIAGAFLCVPLTSILVIILSNFPGTRWLSIFLSKSGRLAPLQTGLSSSV